MFVHLRLHTEFSVVDGATRVDDMVAAAARGQQPALAITDLNNLFGAIKFYKEARGAGVKPIVGCEVMLQGVGADARHQGTPGGWPGGSGVAARTERASACCRPVARCNEADRPVVPDVIVRRLSRT